MQASGSGLARLTIARRVLCSFMGCACRRLVGAWPPKRRACSGVLFVVLLVVGGFVKLSVIPMRVWLGKLHVKVSAMGSALLYRGLSQLNLSWVVGFRF